MDRNVAWSVMAATTLFVLWQMFPGLIVRNTTPSFGDLTGHFTLAWHLRHELLPEAKLSGWAMGWFTGFPVLTFYFPLGIGLVAVLSWIVPLNVALKLAATIGPLALPLAAYAFGRLNGRTRLASACFGVAVLPMLLEPLLHISGGSILSSAGAGEYGYGLAFTLGLLVLGLASAGLRTGRYRALVAGLLAATVLLHVLPAAFVFAGILVLVVLRPTRARARWAGSVAAVAVALTGLWLVPFVAWNRFTGGYDCPKKGPVLAWLLPEGLAPVAVVAGISVAVAVIAAAAGSKRRDSLMAFMVVMALLGAVAFAVTPTGQLCNVRFLPIWALWLCLLMGDAFAVLAEAVDDRRKAAARGRDVTSPSLARIAMPVVLLVASLLVWPSRSASGLLNRAHADTTVIPEGALGGYEHGPQSAEFRELAERVQVVGRRHGCGRAHFEYAQDHTGAPVEYSAFTYLLPIMTDGCIAVSQGLHLESSPTNDVLDFANQRLSSDAVHLSEEKRPFDLKKGVADLRMLGVRYFVARTRKTSQAADRSPELRLVAETKEVEGRFWKVYEVLSGVELVEPLRHEPVVVPGSGRSRLSWKRLMSDWYDGSARDVLPAASGPEEWPRRERSAQGTPRRAVAPTFVRAIRTDDDRISFRVSRTGTPVLVKVSYFPTWRAEGATGPWRVAPNQMVVVPTSKTVTLRTGRAPVEHLGLLVTLVGVGGLVALARRRPIETAESTTDSMPTPKAVKQSPAGARRPKTTPKARRR